MNTARDRFNFLLNKSHTNKIDLIDAPSYFNIFNSNNIEKKVEQAPTTDYFSFRLQESNTIGIFSITYIR